jgi:NTP pyrophosphatase (non-canonical NTP hydrolase)
VLEDKFEMLFKLFNEKAPNKHPVFQAAKIAEETGEAISLAFKLTGLRRENYNIAAIREKLSDELGDIVITTFICAKVCGIDLWRAVERKLDTEIRRWERFEATKS